ncbi:hypothetical protein NSS69_09150 [Macrococcus sp. FSL W8-0367]
MLKSNKLDSDSNSIPISRIQVYRVLNHSTKSIGFSEIDTYSMRKTFGYHYYKKTKDIALLMNLFNHSSQTVILRYIGINQEIINTSISETMRNIYILKCKY